MMPTWLVIIISGLVTYAIRLSFIAIIGRRQPPEIVQRALRFVPPAVLSAIIAPELFLPEGQLSLSLQNPRLIAGVVAMIVAWRFRNAVITVSIGMLVLWLLSWLGR